MRYAGLIVSRATSIIVLLLLAPFTLWWLGQARTTVSAGEGSTHWSALLQGEQQAGIVSGRVLVDEGVPAQHVEVILTARLEGDADPILGHLPLPVGEQGHFESPFL